MCITRLQGDSISFLSFEFDVEKFMAREDSYTARCAAGEYIKYRKREPPLRYSSRKIAARLRAQSIYERERDREIDVQLLFHLRVYP